MSIFVWNIIIISYISLMREAFDVMGEHPFLTVFLCFVLMVVVSEIAEIFKKKD